MATTTAQEVHDLLHAVPSKLDTSSTLRAVRVAISTAWPILRLTEYAAGVVTLAASTFEYSLAAVTPAIDTQLGVGRVYVNVGSGEPEVSRRVRQRYDASADAWYLIVGPSLLGDYVGQPLNIEYQYPHPDVTGLTDSIALPRDYLISFVTYWYAMNALGEQHLSAPSLDFVRAAKDAYESALRRNRTPPIPQSVRYGKGRMK